MEPLTAPTEQTPVRGRPPAQQTDTHRDDPLWIEALRGAEAPGHAVAVARLRAVLGRATHHQIGRMPRLWADLGAVRAAEIAESAADEATMAVLARLNRFEGRSSFTTWVYKFGILHAATEARRALWRDRSLVLDDHPEPIARDRFTPETFVEARDLAEAVTLAIQTVLTPHQRRIAQALIVEEIPIDVLAERLATNRNALYKALHDVRIKLRTELRRHGVLATPKPEREALR
ncbi:MAG: RNA polymerase sigma factor [Sporichthyaceae bacterium]